jgi:putative glycosyltransferase (TIGR04372 family)
MAGERQFMRRAGNILVARPDPQQYGHLAMELLMIQDEARRLRLPIYFLPERDTVNPALYEVEAEGTTVVRPGLLQRTWLRAMWHAGEMSDQVRQRGFEASEPLRAGLTRQLRRAARLQAARWARRPLRRFADRIAAMTAAARGERPYMRRRAMRTRHAVRLNTDAEARAQRNAEELGIPAGARIVVIHAREAGFKRGREVHDGTGKRRHDDLRNARIETYFPAVDRLVRQGYTVVRIGDTSMTTVRRHGIIDVATNPKRIPELDLHLLLRAHFAVTGESGPGQVAMLTNTPTLTLNATDPISSFPVRDDSLYIVKRVREAGTGRVLPLREMLGFDYLRHLRNPGRFEYIDNTPDDIIEAIDEISAIASGRREPASAAQIAYGEMACRAGGEFRGRLQYIRKHGTDDGFLGEGRIGRAFVERYW